ncbi:MAG: hypothetical protein JNK15_16860 [Planctomycetes bacterium]|nr:hypothetical protein [Planctomycetota bacterium]
MAVPSKRRRAPLRLRLLLLGISLGMCALAAEALFHLAPGLLPAAFRLRFPPHGIEFFHPGLLDRTSLGTLPMPFGTDPYSGPPPHDLVTRGIAPADQARLDRDATPRIDVPTDPDGLPNAAPSTTADVVMVGDSFLVYGAQTEPPGLAPTLARELGGSIKNLGVSGAGPDLGLSLLRTVGLPARPRLVLWFFFGGNDVLDAQVDHDREQQGLRTWGDLMRDRRAPRLILPALVASWFQPARSQLQVPAPLPGLTMPAAADAPTWFLPEYLLALAVPSDVRLALPGWARAQQRLREGHAAAVAAGAKFVLVFVPSKEQVHLPYVTIDGPTFQRCAAVGADGEALLAAAKANRLQLEEAVAATCSDAAIPHWSCTATLDGLARAGTSGFYATDTHWNAAGQVAVARALAAHLRAQGIWP